MIIVDGPDGAGKTTLGKQLENTGYVYVESPRLRAKGDAERMKYETERYIRLYGDSPRHVVDRFLFSEMCYGPVLRGKSVFSRPEFLHLVQEIQQHKIFAIFCLPEHRYYKPDESPFLISKMDEIVKNYELSYAMLKEIHPKQTYRYDWEKPDAYANLMLAIEKGVE